MRHFRGRSAQPPADPDRLGGCEHDADGGLKTSVVTPSLGPRPYGPSRLRECVPPSRRRPQEKRADGDSCSTTFSERLPTFAAPLNRSARYRSDGAITKAKAEDDADVDGCEGAKAHCELRATRLAHAHAWIQLVRAPPPVMIGAVKIARKPGLLSWNSIRPPS